MRLLYFLLSLTNALDGTINESSDGTCLEKASCDVTIDEMKHETIEALSDDSENPSIVMSLVEDKAKSMEESNSFYYETKTHGRMAIPDPPSDNSECNLFMAESSIPFAGWGMYTGISLKKDSTIQPLDLAVQVNDQVKYQKRINRQPSRIKDLPDWLMEQYYWNARVTYADYDANSIDSIIPSFGMLANSHTGLVNLQNEGCQLIEKGGDGSQTVYREQSFTVKKDLEAGHELFADYGDAWFEEREDKYGPMPLSKDWRKANELTKSFHRLCAGYQNHTDLCLNLWKLVKFEFNRPSQKRLMKALPESLEDITRAASEGAAKVSLPNVVRTQEWLFANGMCLDHMTPKRSVEAPGMGAFATRRLPQGSLVAPAPLIHMSRDHLAVLITDSHDVTQVLWRGHQLLLNYCYGHPSSSLVFFPYSPVVNFINHSNKKPNVKLQWSSRMRKKDWLQLTTEEVLAFDHSAGLMMEFVALRDIEEGEEIFYDYGESFQRDYDQFSFDRNIREGNWKEADDIKDMKVLPSENNKTHALPPNTMTVCWIPALHKMKAVVDKHNTYTWANTRTEYLDQTHQCWIEKVVSSSPKATTYDVRYKKKNKKIHVKGLPRRAIAIVDRPYTRAQFLRHTFRHEIQLPDEMIPIGWRDRESYDPECGLYMAESAIPHSGLGMYTARTIEEGKHVFHGDVVVQVADYKVNRRLRFLFHKSLGSKEPDWLLDNYYWDADNTLGVCEASKVYSIVPGMGMLANSHTGLFNSGMLRPKRESGGINRRTHPSAGSSTTFHDLTFAVLETLSPGTELYVEYGDSWFEAREEELGFIPLSTDFEAADSFLEEFSRLIGGDFESDMAKDLWDIYISTSLKKEDNRIRNAIPRDLKRVPDVLKSGTAKASVPNQTKPISWLKENGMCLDNIRSGLSGIVGAHRGAFATRPLVTGQVIAPMPVVHIRRAHLEIYDSQDVNDKKKKPWFTGHQLLLNYCYGHANSTVLLFPYSPVVNYVNHASENFNAELRWSTFPHQRHEFKDLSPDELMEHDHSGIILELVATRDIAFDEEILIDYGERWENAWKEWNSKWQPDADENEYIPAFELNDYLTPIRTEEEQELDPYPNNIMTLCYALISGKPIDKDEDGEPTYNWKFKNFLYDTTSDGYPCDILVRSKNMLTYLDDTVNPNLHTYTVRLHLEDDETAIIKQVPRRAIELYDTEYTSDASLSKTFRHEIGLPDHLFPVAWIDH